MHKSRIFVDLNKRRGVWSLHVSLRRRLWQHLRSSTKQLLVVPRHQLSSYGRRAFCVAGPSVWNSLPDNLRNPIIGGNSFKQSLRSFCSQRSACIQRITGFTTIRYINRLFTYFYLLTLRCPPRLSSWSSTLCHVYPILSSHLCP